MTSFVNHTSLTADEVKQYFGDIVYDKHES